MNMKYAISAAAVLIAVAALAGTARADYLKGDPRVCRDNDAKTCVRWASIYTIRQAVGRKEGIQNWQGAVYCNPQHGGLLRQACFYMQGDIVGHANLWFRATSTGWKRIVTFTG